MIMKKFYPVELLLLSIIDLRSIYAAQQLTLQSGEGDSCQLGKVKGLHAEILQEAVDLALEGPEASEEVEDDCAICFEKFEHPTTLLCGHTFCDTCIRNWAEKQEHTCPMCRRKITFLPEGLQQTVKYCAEAIMYPIRDGLHKQERHCLGVEEGLRNERFFDMMIWMYIKKAIKVKAGQSVVKKKVNFGVNVSKAGYVAVIACAENIVNNIMEPSIKQLCKIPGDTSKNLNLLWKRLKKIVDAESWKSWRAVDMEDGESSLEGNL